MGRLLCLKEGDDILLRERLFEVQERRVDVAGDFIVYVLWDDSQHAFLKVERGRNGQACEGCLEVVGFREAVFDDDVVIVERNC